MKEKSLYLSLAFILSAMLHIAVIAHLSGVEWLAFANLDSDRSIDVDLGSKSPAPKRSAVRPADTPLGVRKEEHPYAAAETSPAGQRGSGQRKADSALPYTSAAGSENPALTAEGEAVPSINAAVVTSALAGKGKTEETGPPLMTAAREKFLYDISWSGIHVGQAVLEAFNENGRIRITSSVRSAAVISLFYRVEDFSESSIVNGLPAHFRIKQHEGKYRSDKDTVFDGPERKIIFYNYLNNTMEEHPIKGGLPWDVMSGFYHLRTMPLVEGQTVYVDVFDSGKFLKVAVRVVRKEKIEVPGVGEVATVMVKLLLTSDGLFKSKGNVSIWLTDDVKRIPVRVETKIPIGSVTAELSSMERGS